MGSSSAPPQTTQTNTVEMSPEQRAIFSQAMPFINQYAQSGLTTLPSNLVAGMNPNETQAGSDAITNASGAGQALGQQAANTNAFLLNPSILSADSNPYLKSYGDDIARTMTDSLNNDVLPGLRQGATSAGGMYSGGGTKEGIQLGLASGKNSQAIGQALQGLYSTAYGQNLNALGQAVGQTPLTQQSLLFGPTVQGQVGAQQQAQSQAELDASNQLSQLQQMLPFLKAQDLMSLIGAIPGGSSTATVTGAVPGSNGIMSGLGGAASGAALGSMLMPGVGTAAGALIGGGLGYFGSH